MKNKEIQEKRMKEYFIQATKEILRGEGLKCVNVRNIADKAGYSYATLYNYFRDVNDLVFYCVEDFQEECKAYANGKSLNYSPGIERIKALIVGYMEYFIQYPGVFDLFYLERVGDFGGKESTISVIESSLDSICNDDWNYCLKTKIVDKKDIVLIKQLLRNQVIGLLLLYLNRRIPVAYTDFIESSQKQIDSIVNSRFLKRK